MHRIAFIILNFVSNWVSLKLDIVIVKNGIFFLQKTVTYRTEAHSLSHRVKSYYIIITIIVGCSIC